MGVNNSMFLLKIGITSLCLLFSLKHPVAWAAFSRPCEPLYDEADNDNASCDGDISSDEDSSTDTHSSSEFKSNFWDRFAKRRVTMLLLKIKEIDPSKLQEILSMAQSLQALKASKELHEFIKENRLNWLLGFNASDPSEQHLYFIRKKSTLYPNAENTIHPEIKEIINEWAQLNSHQLTEKQQKIGQINEEKRMKT